MTTGGREPGDTALYSAEDLVDIACDEFEAQWKAGQAPRIEDFLDRFSEGERGRALTELLLVEIEVRQLRGEAPTREDYVRRLPECDDQISAVFLCFQRVGDSTVQFPPPAPWNPPPLRPPTSSTGKMPGSFVGKFELVKLLGTGASGEVWRAQDAELKREVAIKIPRRTDLTADELHRFLREGQAAAQLRHPHIVSVHEVGRDGDHAFIVCDYIAGSDLGAWMAKSRPTPAEAAELCAKLAEALDHAHGHGVIHRDFKPANVLIDAGGHPLITDFGLAKWTSDASEMTYQGQVLGTPAYMSPEQARGEAARVDRRSDVFSLGVVLYELLSGRRAYQGDVAAVVHDVIHKNPPPPRSVNRSVPRDLETICLKAMAKEPSRRYQASQEMAVDLRRFLRGEHILARRAGPLQKAVRWVQRRPALAAALVVAVLAAGTAKYLADKNWELLGMRRVTLTTDPPGAQVAFVPLSAVTAEPQFDNVHYANDVSPVDEYLKPGDYLVVAQLEDGRFHEVYRHVPAKSEGVPFSYNHRIWRRLSDGRLELPSIEILGQAVTRGMALIEGRSSFSTGVEGTDGYPEHTRAVASFYMDTTEFTHGDYLREIPSIINSTGQRALPPDRAASVSYDEAVALAESMGKRLPTEFEFEYAARAGGRTKFPWGDEFPVTSIPAEFGPVMMPEFDRLPTTPPVYGLCSGVAEWTSSWPASYTGEDSSSVSSISNEYRVVRGGNMETVRGDPAMTAAARKPRQRYPVQRHERFPGLGFRCVRSAAPQVSF